MIAATPMLIVILLLLALVSIVVVPGAALLAIPLVIVLALVFVGMAVHGAGASRGGRRVEQREPGAAAGDALSPPETDDRDAVTAWRERTHG
jgi:hypothetical protein